MYEIIKGSCRGINGELVDCWLAWCVLSQDTLANCSQVHVQLFAQARAELSTAWVVPEKFGYVGYDDGNRQYKSTAYDFSGKQRNCFGDYIFTVPHAADGTKTLKLQGMWETSHSQYISGGSAAGVVTLPTIPRQSTVKATDAYVGAVSMVSVLQADSSYSHEIGWKFGILSGYLTAGGEISATPVRLRATTIAFTVPEAFYGQLTHAPTALCTLTCRTYRQDTMLGESSCTFRVTADPVLCAPEVTGTLSDGNEATLALTGNPKVLVRYLSDALCSLTARAKNGAQIAQCLIGGQPAEELCIPGVQTPYVVFQAVDSRGYRTSFVPDDVTMLDYVRLSCHGSVRRTDPTGGNALLEGGGNWWDGNFGAAENVLTLSVSVDGGEFAPLQVEQTEGGYRFSALLSGLDYRHSHVLQIRAQDALDTVTLTLPLGKGIPVFDWDENDFAFHVPVTAPAVAVGEICIAGSDPSQLLGGSWQQVDGSALRIWKKL